MANTKDNSKRSTPRSSCFLGCFGYSGQVSAKKLPHDMAKSDTRRKARWISWSRSRMKKSAVKTVPVDATVTESISQSGDLKSVKRVSSKSQAPANGIILGQNPAASQAHNTKVAKKRYENVQDIDLESPKSLDPSDAVADDTSQKRLPCWKRSSKRAGASHPGSPETQPHSSKTKTSSLSHSASFPAPKQKNPPPPAGVDSKARQVNAHSENDTFAGKFDPLVGMSIIMVTLAIMMLWGKLCAILCTSAWFFCVPRLKTAMKPSNIIVKNVLNSSRPDMDSEEYKKRVVLQGLLDRNHRHVAGIL
ncbi:hypothetical protein RJ639_044511 [Escallonia herrerae]|uniref:Uncharacterized protein n=1 Tax=Escallonia herrerae TaxID=1293975 RepID=A0AA88WBI9_9ASTE|nr:hypothetical protein RJ639_044511 [Escallonia herrerae]